MSSQASAKAADPGHTQSEDKRAEELQSNFSSSLHAWKQVIIAEILNVLERRRYDRAEPR